ncbi:MAG: hypothetical protein RIC52_13450 [Amphiplicatus sp.]
MTSGRFIAVICGLKSEAAAVRAASSSGARRVGVSGASAHSDVARRLISERGTAFERCTGSGT